MIIHLFLQLVGPEYMLKWPYKVGEEMDEKNKEYNLAIIEESFNNFSIEPEILEMAKKGLAKTLEYLRSREFKPPEGMSGFEWEDET